MNFQRIVPAVVVLAALCGAWLAPARAADFYKGKTLTIVVGFSPGGGFDANARVLAHYIGHHIPGNPDTIVVNLPGAASANSILYLDNTGAKDGTVIDTFNFGLIGDSLTQPDRTPIDFRKYSWIGSISEDLTVCYVWSKIGPASIDAMKKYGQFHFGITGVGVSEDINEKILMNIFGVNIRQVAGYPGTAEVRLAVERGELDGDCGAWSSIPDDWKAQHKINPVARSADTLPEGLTASTPYIVKIAPDDRSRQIIRLLVADGDVGRPFIASKAVPAARIKILQDAFAATMTDPGFIADMKKQRLPLSPKNGVEALKTVNEIYATSPDIVAAGKKLLGE